MNPAPDTCSHQKATECRKNLDPDALVVFSDRTTLRRLKCLARGFRHCFVVVRDGAGRPGTAQAADGHWLLLDPLADRFVVSALAPRKNRPLPADQLALGLRRLGYRVAAARIMTPAPAKARPAPVRPLTCVEAVKRILGLRLPWTFTPRQLHRHLTQSPSRSYI